MKYLLVQSLLHAICVTKRFELDQAKLYFFCTFSSTYVDFFK